MSSAYRVLVYLLAVMLATDLTLTALGNSTIFSLILPRLYTLIEFVAISIFFISITTRHSFRKTMIILIAPFVAIVVIDFTVEGILKRDDLSVGIESLIFITYSLITLYYILHDTEYTDILSTSKFWVISAVLLYFGGSVFVFISTNYIAKLSREMFDLIWAIHAFAVIIFCSVLSIGLWKAKESR